MSLLVGRKVVVMSLTEGIRPTYHPLIRRKPSMDKRVNRSSVVWRLAMVTVFLGYAACGDGDGDTKKDGSAGTTGGGGHAGSTAGTGGGAAGTGGGVAGTGGGVAGTGGSSVAGTGGGAAGAGG